MMCKFIWIRIIIENSQIKRRNCSIIVKEWVNRMCYVICYCYPFSILENTKGPKVNEIGGKQQWFWEEQM